MGKVWRVHDMAALGVVVACAAANIVAAAADIGVSPSSGAASPTSGPAARNVTRKSDDGSSYHHVWPPMRFGWRIVLGSLIGFFGAAFGSVGGSAEGGSGRPVRDEDGGAPLRTPCAALVGGGGIFVPMLALVIGVDPKSSTALSKCMIMGASVSTVYYNLKLKHPTLDMPLIDYDLALLIQPMLMLGVSIGVIFNVIFPDWLVTAFMMILFLVTSTKAFLKGVETWEKETITKRKAAKRMEQICQEPELATIIPTETAVAATAKTPSAEKNYNSCSVLHWALNSLQIPVSVGVSMYEAHGLKTGKRMISSKGSQQTTLKPRQLLVYCLFGILAGLVGGLLGLGTGFIMGPLFLELGIPPQVSSATATFAMMFSSSMTVVEYYLLHRFPVPYAAYFTVVASIAAIIGQHCVSRVINWLGRAWLIIFILASMIFVSAISLVPRSKEMGKTWQVHAMAGLAVIVAFAATVAAAANDTKLSPPTGAAARNVTGKSDDGSSYHHIWPPMHFGWRIVLGSLIGFFGAAFGSVGGVGGGGIFVPMLALIIGFDPKSSTAMSKCMIMGAAVSTVYYNLTLRHPTLDMPLIDYDLALLIQPMLMLGVSIGVIFNVIFPDWLVTALLIIIFLVTSTKAFLKGVETWKKETIAERVTFAQFHWHLLRIRSITFPCSSAVLIGLLTSPFFNFQQAAKRVEQICQEPEHATTIPTEPAVAATAKTASDEKTSFLKNVYWREFGLLAFVWMAFLGLQIAKNYTSSCSVLYWVLNSLQIPVSVGVTMYEAHGLMTGKRVLSSKGSQQSTLNPRQLFVYCLFGILAGIVGGLLGLGGGFIMGPLFLELGIPPQVSSATATFAMMFSSSMSVVEYYLLHRFPVPYAAYFATVAFIAAIIGQHCVTRLINWLGRASLIIFILASMIFISAISLGGVGISNIVYKMERHQYMGFESLCN
ncbi:hypothetical protein EJB05_42692, partial [Eragrostis curvula]